MAEGLQDRLEERLASPRLTPMMRQYLTVKSEHPDAIVLFRMGDFFETFFEDAEECARRLDITLTARSKERDIPMAGVPHHAIQGYLARLVEQGCTVVMVDQVEDPKKAKGLVKREITRIVTPGTFLDPSAPARQANYLASVDFGKSRKTRGSAWGLAALDLATGDFRATRGEGAEVLLDEIARLACPELVLSSSQAEVPEVAALHAARPDMLLTRVDDRDYAPAAARSALASVLGKKEVEALGGLLDGAAMVAAGRALLYVQQTQVRGQAPDLKGRASLGHIHTLRPYVPGEALVLDREARAHLELFATSRGTRRGSLLSAIDRAVTPMGARLLSEWLSYPTRDPGEASARHVAVEAWTRSAADLDAVREALRSVADTERLVGRAVLGRALPRDLEQLALALEAAPSVLATAAQAATPRGELLASSELISPRLAELASTSVCPDVRALLAAALAEEPSNDFGAGAVFAPGYDEEIDRLTEIATRGKELIRELEAREKASTGIPSLKVRFNKVFGYYIEVTKTNLSLVPDHYVRKQTTVNAERFFTDELKELEDEVLNADERRLAQVEKLYAELLAKISASATELRRLSRALAEVDVLSAFAHLAETMDWVRPELVGEGSLDIQDGRHPVLEQLAGELGERFVPNDVRLDADERLMIITGPNMAGKSTIMRQTALIVILAHMGSFVPARRARLGRVDRIFTRVGASDDLTGGRSTFMVEMTETARILRSATEYDLIILDEIGRGTSTFDGLSIAWAVAEHLHDRVRARTMFATHYHEMTELCRAKPNAVNRHVAVREHEDDIVFLRKLVPGATNRSYGVQVARLAGLPRGVLERAREVLDGLEAQALDTGQGRQAFLSGRGSRPQRDQLPLFSAATAPVAHSDPRLRKLVDRLAALDVDDLSPRQALDVVAELQAMVPPSARS